MDISLTDLSDSARWRTFADRLRSCHPATELVPPEGEAPTILMRRKLIIVLLALVGVAVLIVATVPLWLGVALRLVAPQGLTVGEYETVGYARFSLSEIRLERPNLVLTVSRVEAPTPIVWWWQHQFGRVGPISLGSWTLTVLEGETSSDHADNADRSVLGWVEIRDRINAAVEQLQAWAPRVETGRGTVRQGDRQIAIDTVVWNDRELRLRGIAYQEHAGNLTVAFPAGADTIRLQATQPEQDRTLELVSRGARLDGHLFVHGEKADITAEWPRQKWIPSRAEITVRDWTLRAAEVGLGAHYSTLHGGGSLRWSDGQFSVDLAASAAPATDGASPPLELAVQAAGTPDRVRIETLRATAPGLEARLSAPVVLTRDGRMEGPGAELSVQADLAKQPWVRATGSITGQVVIDGLKERPPTARFVLHASDVAANEVSIASADLSGTVRWPSIVIDRARLRGTDNREIIASGTWNTATWELGDAAVSGLVGGATLARWLPEEPDFEAVSIRATASGAWPQLRHAGDVTVHGLTLPSSGEPAKLDVTWRGRGQEIESLAGRASAGQTTLTWMGALDTRSARLTHLSLARAGRPPLELAAPTTVEWGPSVTLAPLRLQGGDTRVAAEGTWGPEGNLALIVENLSSEWLADLIAPGALTWKADLALKSHWNRGPMVFEAAGGMDATLATGQAVQLDFSVSGDEEALVVRSLRANANAAPVIQATGRLPVSISPVGQSPVAIDSNGEISFTASAAPNTTFWTTVEQLTGIRVGEPTLDLRIDGTVEQPRGELRLHADRVALDPARFGRELPSIDEVDVHVTGSRSRLAIAKFLVSVEGQPIRAAGVLPVPNDDWKQLAAEPRAVLRSGANATISIPEARIAAFQRFLPEMLAPTGELRLEATLRDGEVGGTLVVRDAASRPLGPLGVIRDINGEIELEGRTLRLKSVGAQTGGQPLALSGTVQLPADLSDGSPPRFDVTLSGRNVPFVRQSGLLVRGDIDLALQTPAPSAPPRLSGRVTLRDSLFLQDIRALLPSGGGAGGPSRRPPYFSVDAPRLREWTLDVEVSGDEFIRLRTPAFTGVASAQLTLRGTLGDPRAVGQITIDEGNVLMPFATFEVQQGTVRLTEENPHEPRLYVRATTRKYGYDLTLEVEGPASEPQIEFSSSPPLESEQVLLMVTAGIVPSDQIAYSNTQRAARIGAYLGRSLLGSLGAGSGGDRLTIESGADISRQGRETYNIEYELNDRWTATGEYNEFDEYNAGLRWRIYPRPEKDDPPAEGEDDAAAETADSPAEIEVSGLGWLKRRELRSALDRLLITDERATLDANAIEDAAVILTSALKDEGFQDATITIQMTDQNGNSTTQPFDPTFAEPLPRPVAARRVEFHVDPGARWHIADVNISGVTAMDAEQAEAYFKSEAGLLASEKTNAYSESRVRRAAGALAAELEQQGFIDAEVDASVAEVDRGAVTLNVSVDQGPQWELHELEYNRDDATVGLPPVSRWEGRPLTPTLEQDLKEAIRQAYYSEGYPDVGVHLETEVLERRGGMVAGGLVATIIPGPQVSVGQVRFEGNEVTKESVLRRRVRLGPGDPLNPVELERARYRLARLGVFDSVELDYRPGDGPVRDPVFTLEESRRLEASLLFGYGSYEQLRAGIVTRQLNLFGLAHQSRLKAVQSMKSTSVDLTYTVPELFGETVDGSFDLYGLRREEIAFLREEFGAGMTVRRAVPSIGGEASLRYSFESLSHEPEDLVALPSDEAQINVASFTFTLRGDRRDNPLLPRKGHDWSVRIEAADPWFGGDATYQRLELGGSYHTSWGKGRWIHAGLTHGVITTIDGDDSTLPVNRRFFPGGDSSIRGYQNGEAAPRGPDGRFIGAKSYLLLNLEVEQALTASWSVVAFADAITVSARLGDYLSGQQLYSVGLGVRYQTLIGPVRLEYGRNVNPRPRDPSGTLHLSIGFPF